MKTNYLIGIVIVIILAIGAYFVFSKPAVTPTEPAAVGTVATSTPGTTDEPAANTGNAGTGVGVSVGVAINPITVTYTDRGFSPASVTVKKGQAVTFVNKSSNDMWVASDPHPLHDGYDGVPQSQHCAADYTGPKPFDECGRFSSFTFTFDKTGTWGYHNHIIDQDGGTVVVTQ